MAELILEDLPRDESSSPAEFYLGTLSAWGTDNGASVKLDGQDQAGTKRYKMMLTGRPLYEGQRYLVMKQSGTYILLGEIGLPPTRRYINDLADNADLAAVISKINTILLGLREQGILKTQE